MVGWTQIIRTTLILFTVVVELRSSFAWLLSFPKQQQMASVDKDFFDTRMQLESQKKRCRREQHKRQQICGAQHRESRITAAGVEPLFSRSLWSFSSTPVFTPTGADSDPYMSISSFNSADLPPIDCEWACHSNEEILALRRMKLLLVTDMKTLIDRRLYPDVYGDLRLLRFLRKDKSGDIVSSSQRYRSFLKWRERNNVDDIRAAVENDNGGVSFMPQEERLHRVALHFPMDFSHTLEAVACSDNRQVGRTNAALPAILYVGAFDTVGITEKIRATDSNASLNDFLDYWIYLYEAIHLNLYRSSLRSGTMIFLDEVCDLSDLSLQQFSPYFVTKVMKPWLRMTQANYPETTRKIYILKPPAIMTFAWNLVTPLLSQGTVDKIRFEKEYKGPADAFCKMACHD